MSEVDDLVAGRYRLRAMVGCGAMGVVWQATDTTLHRTVALKQLLQPNVDPQLAEQAQQRALREGRIAARLHHPNAVTVHDVVIDNGLPVLVMEYLPSRSLADLIAEHGRLAPEMVAHIGAQVAAALSAAHAAGIVHRDVKPANILITEDGTAKLTDFGISHAAGDVALTQTGLFAGTPAYLAPEIALGHRPTPASDIFSLGTTLYAAAEGGPPFGDDAENPLALLHIIAAGHIHPPRQAGPLTPVLAATLNSDPARRVDAGQTSDALHATATGAPLPPFVETAAAPWAETGTATTATTPAVTPAPVNGTAGTLLDGHPAPGTAPAPVANGPAGTLLDGQPLLPRAPVAALHGSGAGANRTGYIAVGVAAAVIAAIVLLVSLLNSSESTPVAIAAPDSPTPTTPAVRPADLEHAALRYYRLLPEHAERAWQRFAPSMRTGDRGAYFARWRAVDEVMVFSHPRVTGDSTVHIGVTLRLPDGSHIREFRQLGFATNTATPLISSMALLHRQRIPAPQPPEIDYDEEYHYDEKDKEEEQKEKEKEKKAEEKFKDGEKPEGWEAHWKEE